MFGENIGVQEQIRGVELVLIVVDIYDGVHSWIGVVIDIGQNLQGLVLVDRVPYTRSCLWLFEVLLPRRTHILLFTSEDVGVLDSDQGSFVGGISDGDVISLGRWKFCFGGVDLDVAVRLHWEFKVILASAEVNSK